MQAAGAFASGELGRAHCLETFRRDRALLICSTGYRAYPRPTASSSGRGGAADLLAEGTAKQGTRRHRPLEWTVGAMRACHARARMQHHEGLAIRKVPRYVMESR